MKYLTVTETVKKFGLEIFDKRYKDQYGRSHNTDIPLIDLAQMPVKDVYVNFPMEEAIFTIIVNK